MGGRYGCGEVLYTLWVARRDLARKISSTQVVTATVTSATTADIQWYKNGQSNGSPTGTVVRLIAPLALSLSSTRAPFERPKQRLPAGTVV